MTDLPMPPLQGQSGPEGEETNPSIVRETLDLSQLITGASAHARIPPNEANNNQESVPRQAQTQTQETQETTTETGNAKKKKRQSFSFSNRHFKCNSELFLDPKHKEAFLERYPNDLEIVGKVTQCPTTKNGRIYGFRWITSGTQLEIRWTQNFIDNSPEFREKLKGLIQGYEEEQRELTVDLESNPAASQGTTGSSTDKGKGTSTGRALRTPATKKGKVPPPTSQERADAYASLKTACSAGSGTASQPKETTNRRITRGDDVDGIDSDSDDGDDLDQHDDAFDRTMAEGYDSDEDIYEIQATDGTTVAKEDTYGKLAQQLKWKFQNIDPGDVPFTETKNMLRGTTKLKPGAGDRWNDPFECFQRCGFSREFVAALTRESNDYAKNNLLDKHRKKKLCGANWKDISVTEMSVFLGILLKISLSPTDGGGYAAYFEKEDITINYCNHREPKAINDSAGWAYQYMTLLRFKQIRSAFHPEDKEMGGGSSDKCYQLRRAINSTNSASKSIFEAGSHCAFDEGGVACRSRFCPVRQYNKDKPNKFRVDFFILACSTTYAIFHIDVYQGRNATNVGIEECIQDLPTTQKAVMNAVMCTFGNDGQGARHIAMDNRYMCPELAVLLLTKCGCYSTGTCRRRRKGFPDHLLDLEKKDGRGEYKLVADKVNRLLMMQWVDNKVVTMVSSNSDTTIGTVKRQIGPLARQLDCPTAMIRYQRTMFGVDKGDELRAHFGGFSTKAHFKKWYKRVFLAILDVMLMNAHIAWNLSAKEKASRNRNVLERHQFMQFVAECLLHYNEPEEVLQPKESTAAMDTNHRPMQPKKGTSRNRCIVCRLENGKWFDPKLGETGTRSGLAVCSECGIYAHNHIVTDSDRKIHNMQPFQNKTCFEIAHLPEGLALWPLRQVDHCKGSRSMCRTAPVFKALRKIYGKPEVETRKRKRRENSKENKNKSDATESNGVLYDSSDNELYE
ncbi:unknown protein [Seminavis robusta]|uniref:PiggyBac transposable element-derived protein domain-containing protein n=1 Tax=Seminavis robusta TaxID=568900 RepID=A0A9N8F0D6_9STRA|nr:unknown protein [Seminavis robusta]|eukprot:Sro3482_g348480.1 n/a (963) ;mRNA; f:2004-4892